MHAPKHDTILQVIAMLRPNLRPTDPLHSAMYAELDKLGHVALESLYVDLLPRDTMYGWMDNAILKAKLLRIGQPKRSFWRDVFWPDAK